MKSRVLLSLAAIAGVCVTCEVLRRAESSIALPGSGAHGEVPIPVRVLQASPPPRAQSGPSHSLQGPANHPTKLPEGELTTSDLPASRLLRQLEAGLKTYDPGNSAGFFTLLTKLVENSPAAAAQFSESLSVGPVRTEALVRVTQTWAGADPASAESWAAQLPDRNERQATLANVCFKVSEGYPALALEMAVNHQLDRSPGVLENLVSQWAGQDYVGAVAWAKSQRSGQSRDQIFERLSAIGSVTAPAEAAKLVADEIAPGPVQDNAVVSVLTVWAMRDATGARAWVNQFPSGPLKDRARDLLAGIASADHGRNK